MNKLQLGILFGGQSSEHSVSLHSAGSFLRQIHQDQYDMHLIGITPDGRFLEVDGNADDVEHNRWQEKGTPISWTHGGYVRQDGTFVPLDTVFPILHGKNGEDGTLQGMMELLNIRCAGCDALSSAMVMDKDITHNLLNQAGIPTANHVTLRQEDPLPDFEELEKELPLPWFVKPCSAGSSYGVHKVHNKEEFLPAVQDAFQYDGRGKILVEQGFEGFEIGCAVMGNASPIAGAVDEIALQGEFFDFDGKYEMEGAAIYCPARISPEATQKARELAIQAYKAMNCRGLARVDMFINPQEEIIVNELNTIPGFTATSRYPTMMKEYGIPFPELIDRLIALSMETEVGRC